MPFTHKRVANTVGIVLTLVAIISLVFSWKASADERDSNHRLKTYVQCQADWNNFLFIAIQASRNANADTTQALDDLIKSISSASSAADSRAALTRYQEARDKQKLSQTQNPLPPPPRSICKLEDK